MLSSQHMDKNEKKTSLIKINFIIFISLLALFIFSPAIYAQPPISNKRKLNTLKYIQKVKQSLGMKPEEISQEKAVEEKEQVRQREYIQPPKGVVEKPELFQEEIGRAKVKYLGTTRKVLYPAEEKSPGIITILQPYHPNHPDFKVPYPKNKQGLKINPILGIDAKHKIDEQLVPLETLIQEAKEFEQSTEAELRDYISINDKKFSELELYLYHKPNWPSLKYVYHTEKVKRIYPAKELWSANTIWSENQDYHDISLTYTIPSLKYLGYIKLEPGYRRIKRYSDNDAGFFGHKDRYHLSLTTKPWDDIELFLEYNYSDEDKRGCQIYGTTLDGIEKWDAKAELKFEFPRYYLKIIPSYYYSDEEWLLRGAAEETWLKHEIGLDMEKELNGDLKILTDWGLILLERDKAEPAGPGLPTHIKAKALTFKNELEYEILRDFKLSFLADWGHGLDLDGFDYFSIGSKARFYKPGIIDVDFGYKYTDYYNISDHLNTIYFKVHHLTPWFIQGKQNLFTHFTASLGQEWLRYEEHEPDTNIDSDAETANQVLRIEGIKRWESLFGGVKAVFPVHLGDTTQHWYQSGSLIQTNTLKYGWTRIDGYLGYPLVNWLNPYTGVRWSVGKLYMSDIVENGTPVSGTPIEKVKSYNLLLGIRGSGEFSPKWFWNYWLEYFIPLYVENTNSESLGLEIHDKDGYTAELKCGLGYAFNKSLVFNAYLYGGRMHWEGSDWKAYQGSLVKWPENDTDYWGVGLNFMWGF